MKTTNNTAWAFDPQSHGSQRAMKKGQEEALAEIAERAEALKSAAFDGPPTPASRKAEGALLIWRAAYAEAYRELLTVEEWERSLARGSGLPPSINKHPFERARDNAAYVAHEAYMAELDAQYPERRKGVMPPWWEEGNALQEAIGQQKPKQDDDSFSEEQIRDLIAAKALEEGWDSAKCAAHGVTEDDLELSRRMKAAGWRAFAKAFGVDDEG